MLTPLDVPAPAMSTSTPAPRASTAHWTGRILATLVVAFLVFDTVIKLIELEPAVQGTAELGFSPSFAFWLGVIELGCLVAYLVPRTALLGAILWTGYLGGAIATKVRLGSPLFSHTLFPIYVAAMLWLGIWLRDPELRALLPWRNGRLRDRG
jgi:hypothetical protein